MSQCANRVLLKLPNTHPQRLPYSYAFITEVEQGTTHRTKSSPVFERQNQQCRLITVDNNNYQPTGVPEIKPRSCC